MIYNIILMTTLNNIHKIIPTTVGMSAARSVHLMLPVSFFIVMSVVEQGKCIRVKIIMHTALARVKPLAARTSRMARVLVISLTLVPEV